MLSVEDIANSLGLGVEFAKVDDHKVHATFQSSDEYGDAYATLSDNEWLDVNDDLVNLSLFSSTFTWVGEKNGTEFSIKLESDFEHDIYEVDVWLN